MHPEGFHKDEEAKARCWGCSHPDNLLITDEDVEFALGLVAQGYMSTSNKYRSVARTKNLPFEEFVTVKSTVPSYLLRSLQDAWRMALRNDLRLGGSTVEQLTLTVGQFRAFKKLGGDTA